MFRMFLVVHSGRGLVLAGAPNLHLFNILYFVVVTVNAVLSIAFYSSKPSQAGYREYLELLAWAIIDILITIFMERKKKKCVTHRCLNQTTFAAVGGCYQRNIFSGKETRDYLFCVQSILILDSLNGIFSAGSLNHKIGYGLILIYWVSIFAVYIPVKHYLHSRECFPEIFSGEKKIPRAVFFMTKPSALIPRHPCNTSLTKKTYHSGHMQESPPQQGSSSMVKKDVACVAVFHAQHQDHHSTIIDIEI